MKRVAVLLAFGIAGFLAGCNSDGVEFNGSGGVEQFPIRTTPIPHFNLPSEMIDPVTGVASLNDAMVTANIMDTTFTELASPGHDLWAMHMTTYGCSDNTSACRTMTEVPDWPYMFLGGYAPNGLSGAQAWPPSGSWPHPNVTTTGTGAMPFVSGWIMSFMNQWMLRGIDGTPLPSPMPGEAPILYESVSFASMPIGFHEIAAATPAWISPLVSQTPPQVGQQETDTVASVGANGLARVIPPMNNTMGWGFDGNSAPAGILAMGWREPPAENQSIETMLQSSIGGSTMIVMQSVTVPDYFGGGGTISGGGGVFFKRYIDQWWQTTDNNPVIDKSNGQLFSYYAAAVGNHVVGYGVGLLDSSFASSGSILNNQEDIMNQSVTLDMTAFIASGKQFQFTTEDLLRMQDTVNGDWMAPGQNSTLPGTHR